MIITCLELASKYDLNERLFKVAFQLIFKIGITISHGLIKSRLNKLTPMLVENSRVNDYLAECLKNNFS